MALTKLAYNGDSKIIKNLVNQVNQLIDGGGGGGASSLVDLDDTSISSPTNGQILEYDSQTSKWKNANPPVSGVEDVKVDGVSVVTQGVANLTTPDLDDLESVTISSPTNGQVLKYNNTTQKWENADESGGGGGGGSLSRTELFKSQNENAVWDNNGIALSDDIENYDDVEIVLGFTNAGTSDRAKQAFRYNSKWFADNFAYVSSANPNSHAIVLLWTGQGFSLGWDGTNKKIMMWSQNGSAGIWAVYGIKYGGSGGSGSTFVEEELVTASNFSDIAVNFSTDYDEFIFYANDVTTQKSESYTYTRNEITDAINNNSVISFYPYGSSGYCQYNITRSGLQKIANSGGFYIYKIIGLKFGGGGGGGHVIIDENDTEMTQRKGLQFIGNVSVSDDSAHDKTIINISGDSVSYTQTLATGEKVGEIEINGTSQDINAPKYKIAVKTNLVGVKYLELSSPDSGDSSTVLASAINPSIIWYQNALLSGSGDFIGSLGVDNVSMPIYARTYIGGDGVEVNQLQTGEGEISLEYLKVVDGAVNLVFDDGN